VSTRFAVLALGLAVAACASGPGSYGRLHDVSADECAVISAYVRDLPSRQKAGPAKGAEETFLSIAGGGIQLGTGEKQPSAETAADLRAKFGHPARLDGCVELKDQAAAAGWRFAPRVPRNIGDKGSYWSVDRVGLNGDHTEAVLRMTVGGSYGSGRFAWFEMKTLLFRKDPRTGEWREAAVLQEVVT
jgi:hypothetical protein